MSASMWPPSPSVLARCSEVWTDAHGHGHECRLPYGHGGRCVCMCGAQGGVEGARALEPVVVRVYDAASVLKGGA